MDTVFPLDFTTTSITVQDTNLVVQYLTGVDVVCGIVINTAVGGLTDGSVLNGKPFLQSVSLTRAATAGGQFATIASGSLTFAHYSTTTGQTVSGSFSMTLTDGHTLTGAFDGTIHAVAS